MSNAAASRLVLGNYSESLAAEAARSALAEIGGRVTCGIVFCSADYRDELPDFLEVLQLHAHIPLLTGCSGSGFVGTGAESENARGFSLLLLHLPQTKVTPFSFSEADAPSWEDGEAWRRIVGVDKADAWMLLADPSTVSAEPWLAGWCEAFPGTPCFGGLGSGGKDGGDIFVFRNRELVDGGVALGFTGGVKIDTIVSQGCRPIGHALPVTGVDNNIIHTLGSRPAYQVLDEAFQSLPDHQKERARGNLFAGLAMHEEHDEFLRGDFLIRNILGADQESGAVAVGAFPRVGQTVQYQYRDARAADEDMRERAEVIVGRGVKPFASLVFSCGGRGRHLFGTPNHDAALIAEYFSPHASAGLFCNGEIGAVAGRNFIHGYTASVALFS